MIRLSLSTQDIISLFNISKNASVVSLKCVVVAKLLKEKADIESIQQKKMTDMYQKSLELYIEAFLSKGQNKFDFRDYYDDIYELADKLKGQLTEETNLKLTICYEKMK